MTKLMEWVTIFVILASIWLSLITNKIAYSFTRQYRQLIVYSPIIFAGIFGLYAVCVVLYRTLTFNVCGEAAKELQQEIVEARAALKSLKPVVK